MMYSCPKHCKIAARDGTAEKRKETEKRKILAERGVKRKNAEENGDYFLLPDSLGAVAKNFI